MSAAAGSTMGLMRHEEPVLDQRIAGILEQLRVRRAANMRFDQDVMQRYMRGAYFDGYADALTDEQPLTEEIPMLNHYQLFLP